MNAPPTYPALKFCLRNRTLVTILPGVLILFTGCTLAAFEQGWIVALITLVLSLLAYGAMRLVMDILRLMAYTLLPD